MDIRAARCISELMGVAYIKLFMAPQRNNIRGDKLGDLGGQVTGSRRSIYLMVKGNTFHNEMVPHPVATICAAEQLRGYRYTVPELHPVERRDICQSPVEAVRSRMLSSQVKFICLSKDINDRVDPVPRTMLTLSRPVCKIVYFPSLQDLIKMKCVFVSEP
ncbi:hypothetical protein TNCV_190921 [Trichonephila clavipes]|nr:hypothetical protein TNCV_190921 [Trichonephila clavipes]